MNDLHNYDDIIHQPHHVSKKHPPMKQQNRAAQFAPFAALTGHKEMVEETQRLTEQKRCLDENQKELLDQTLQLIQCDLKLLPLVKITYFVCDEYKEGGSVQTIINKVRRIDEIKHELMLIDHTKINIDDIYDIEYLKDLDE